MVTQWYDPETGAAAVPGSIARSLRRHGHRVEVLTGFPNYPSGRVYPGYSVRPYRREVLEGVLVHRAPLYPSHDTRALRRAANYLSFAVGASAVGIRRLRHVEAVLVHSSPATAAIPAMVLRALSRTPYVVHVQDLWPQTVVSSGLLESRGTVVERILHRFCDSVYRYADAVAVTSPGMAGLIAERGVPESKIVVVPNWADESAFRPVEPDPSLAARLGITAPFTVMYAGNMGEFQSIDVLVETATRLRDEPEIGFALVGGGVEEARLRSMVAERGLTNVTFVGPQPFEMMAAILALGTVQVVSLKDLPLFRTTLPSKLQGIMAAGRPIIGAVTGDAAEAVLASGGGVVVTPGSVEEMSAAVLELRHGGGDALRARGEASRAYYLSHFSEQVNSELLSRLLVRAAERRGRR